MNGEDLLPEFQRLETRRAFIKKALSFIKYYPLTRKDPAQMLLKTLRQLVRLVDRAEDVSELEPLSREIQMTGNYSNPEELFQIEVIGENNRYIIYRPSKFLEPGKDCEKTICIYDLLYIPQKKHTRC